MSTWTWVLNIGLIILYIITGYFITQASTYLYSYSDDPNLYTAHKLATISAVIPWMLIALTILGVILYFYFYAESGGELQLASKLSKGESWWPTIFFIVMLALISLTGGLSAASAHYIQISNSTVQQVKSAYYDTIISSVLSLVIVIFILIYICYQTFSTHTPEQMNKEQI